MKAPSISIPIILLTRFQSGTCVNRGKFRPETLNMINVQPVQDWIEVKPDLKSRTQTYQVNGGRKSEVFVHEKISEESIRHVDMRIEGKNQHEVSFVVLADSGVPGYDHLKTDGFDGFQKALGDKISSLKNQIDFVVMAGDNFYDAGVTGCNDKQWEKVWFERLKVEELNVPFFTVLGNHDVLSRYTIVQSYFHTCPEKEHMSKYWMTPDEDYTLTVNGKLKMFFINTNPRESREKTKKSVENIESAIKGFEPHFVIGHHPMSVQGKYNKVGNYFVREHPSEENKLKGESLMAAMLHRMKCFTYICGHLHAMQYGETESYQAARNRLKAQSEAESNVELFEMEFYKKTQILVGGGGGSLSRRLYVSPPSSKRQKTRSSKSFDEEVHGFAVVSVNLQQLTQTVRFYTYADDGIGSWEVHEVDTHKQIQ